MVLINVTLSTESITRAIERLTEVLVNLEEGLTDMVTILTEEGAEIAQGAYGGMASASPVVGGTSGAIIGTGEAVVIAEFGAGDATVDPSGFFEGSPSTPVYPGSYSLLEGSGEYYRSGAWHFGGQRYTQVAPRLGLYQAKQHIIENSTEVALGVIKL